MRSIVSTGDSSNRIDIIFLGDGYTSAEIASTYTADIQGYLDYIFSDSALSQPFGRYESFFNVWAVDVVSNQSGADDQGTGTFRDTALDAKYYWDGVTERLLYVDETKATNAMNAALSGTGIDAEMRYVLVNDSKYGGGGGYFGVYAAGNSNAKEIALHEIGHSFAGLADEYGGNSGTYSGGEPTEANVTKNSTGAKWSEWLGYVDPILGVVGAYQGGYYYDQGVYRPTDGSKMRYLDEPFDPIAREEFVHKFYALVDPLDGYDDNSGTRFDVPTLSVDVIDDDVICVDWTVNGQTFVDVGATFNFGDYGYGEGSYTVTCRAYDPTDWVRGDRSDLEESVTWTVVNGAAVVAGLVSIGEVTVTEGNSGTKVATFAVTRWGGSAAFNVAFATSDGGTAISGTDYVGQSGTLSFASGVNSQTISVTINGDTVFEADETFRVTLSGATNGATIYNGVGVGTINNDDSPAPPTGVTLSTVVAAITENSPTASRIRIADIVVADVDGGANTLSLTGADAGVFEIVGTGLFLKAGTKLDFETKKSYAVAVQADDESIGASPDATSSLYTLGVVNVSPEVLTGTSRANVLVGGKDRDKILGLDGKDRLDGGAGRDTLVGGLGRDTLKGGSSSDVFDFNSIAESKAGTTKRDVIDDFHHNKDRIDLRTIDAIFGHGNQTFKWIGKDGFDDVAGQLRYRDIGDDLIVEGDTNGDGKADFQLLLMNISTLGKGDFML